MSGRACRVFLAPLIAALLFFSTASEGSAIAAPDSSATSMESVPVNPLRPALITVAPRIDGILDEPFWQSSPHVTGFKTFLPDFDIVPREQTVVSLAYDRENLYFAFRCFDDVTKIKASVAARDKMVQDDFICINLDTFNDQQGLTAFYVNPLGIQGDSRFAANNEDFSQDFVWYSAGKIDSVGYSVEVQLPLKSLRYANDDPTMMGVILERFISRRSEHSCFPRLDPGKGFALLTQMYPLAYAGVEHYTLVELLPAVTSTRQDARHATTLERDKQETEISLTGKYGITSDLILDGTLNPDFSQVESDAGQVAINLRYSLFYPEKRPFFLEGQDNFNLAATANDFDPTIYYSRRVADPLLGTKLTGKLGSGNTLAALYAVDNVLDADRETLGRYVHVPVLRFKRTLANDSYVGLLYAGRELEGRNNRVVGFDEQIRVSDAAVLESNGFLSWAKDDPGGEAVEGNTLGMRFASGTRNLDFSLNARSVSEEFRADMGYLTRTGVLNFIGFLRPKFYPNSAFIQRVDVEFATGQTQDRPSGLWETGNDFSVNVYFGGDWLFRTRLNYSTEIFAGERFQTSGAHVQLRAQPIKEVTAVAVYHRVRSIYYRTAEQGKSNLLTATLTWQLLENFLFDGRLDYGDFYRDADQSKLDEETLTRVKLTYQVNPSLFFRGIVQNSNAQRRLTTDFLVSFNYIPGTAVYLGYGSVFERIRWDGAGFVPGEQFVEQRRGLFLKMSYLWRS